MRRFRQGIDRRLYVILENLAFFERSRIQVRKPDLFVQEQILKPGVVIWIKQAIGCSQASREGCSWNVLRASCSSRRVICANGEGRVGAKGKSIVFHWLSSVLYFASTSRCASQLSHCCASIVSLLIVTLVISHVHIPFPVDLLPPSRSIMRSPASKSSSE